MIINELLVDKYRVQKALDQEVDHNLARYVSETHKRVQILSKKFGLQFKYGIPRMTDKEKLDKSTDTGAYRTKCNN